MRSAYVYTLSIACKLKESYQIKDFQATAAAACAIGIEKKLREDNNDEFLR